MERNARTRHVGSFADYQENEAVSHWLADDPGRTVPRSMMRASDMLVNSGDAAQTRLGPWSNEHGVVPVQKVSQGWRRPAVPWWEPMTIDAGHQQETVAEKTRISKPKKKLKATWFDVLLVAIGVIALAAAGALLIIGGRIG